MTASSPFFREAAFRTLSTRVPFSLSRRRILSVRMIGARKRVMPKTSLSNGAALLEGDCVDDFLPSDGHVPLDLDVAHHEGKLDRLRNGRNPHRKDQNEPPHPRHGPSLAGWL